MLGGALRGFNLLLVIAGILIAASLVQWRFSRRVSESLRLRRRLPREVYVGKPARIEYLITNQSFSLTAWMVRVEEHLHDRDDSEHVSIQPLTCAKIGPQESITTTTRLIASRRGLYRLNRLTAATTFPLDLLLATTEESIEQEIEIFPRLLKLRRGWQAALGRSQGGLAGTVNRSGRGEGDFFGLRPWQNGDTLRHIHWRTTARIGQPVVSQFEHPLHYELHLLVDAFEDVDVDSHKSVEKAISFAGTISTHLTASPHNRVIVTVAAQNCTSLLIDSSSKRREAMLSMLARTRTTSDIDFSVALKTADGLNRRPMKLVVISPRSREAADQKADVGAILRGHAADANWIDVSDPIFEERFAHVS